MDKITGIIKKVYYKYENARNNWMQGKASKSLEEMINEIADETKTKILAEIERVLKENGGWNLSVCKAIDKLKERKE